MLKRTLRKIYTWPDRFVYGRPTLMRNLFWYLAIVGFWRLGWYLFTGEPQAPFPTFGLEAVWGAVGIFKKVPIDIFTAAAPFPLGAWLFIGY